MNFENTHINNQSHSNMNVDMDNFITGNYNQHKLKLDDILESIKNIKNINNIAEELRVAVKLLKRFKLCESSKW
jgi:hypothetical protein